MKSNLLVAIFTFIGVITASLVYANTAYGRVLPVKTPITFPAAPTISPCKSCPAGKVCTNTCRIVR